MLAAGSRAIAAHRVSTQAGVVAVCVCVYMYRWLCPVRCCEVLHGSRAVIAVHTEHSAGAGLLSKDWAAAVYRNVAQGHCVIYSIGAGLLLRVKERCISLTSTALSPKGAVWALPQALYWVSPTDHVKQVGELVGCVLGLWLG